MAKFAIEYYWSKADVKKIHKSPNIEKAIERLHKSIDKWLEPIKNYSVEYETMFFEPYNDKYPIIVLKGPKKVIATHLALNEYAGYPIKNKELIFKEDYEHIYETYYAENKERLNDIICWLVGPFGY